MLCGRQEGVRPAPSRQVSCVRPPYIALNVIEHVALCFARPTPWSRRPAMASGGADTPSLTNATRPCARSRRHPSAALRPSTPVPWGEPWDSEGDLESTILREMERRVTRYRRRSEVGVWMDSAHLALFAQAIRAKVVETAGPLFPAPV